MINKQQRWKLKYFEKNRYESHVNIFKSLEIESYLKQHFKRYGLNLHSYKINFLATKIVIYLTINENTRTQDEKKKMEAAKHEAIHRTTRKKEKKTTRRKKKKKACALFV